MKPSNEKDIREAISEMLNTFHLREKLNERRLIDQWESIFGKTINKYTTKISVRSGKLFLKVDSSALRQELLFNKNKILATIDKEIEAGFVTDIILL